MHARMYVCIFSPGTHAHLTVTVVLHTYYIEKYTSRRPFRFIESTNQPATLTILRCVSRVSPTHEGIVESKKRSFKTGAG